VCEAVSCAGVTGHGQENVDDQPAAWDVQVSPMQASMFDDLYSVIAK
jgi:hypothetical protein